MSSSINGKIANGKMNTDDIYENLPCHERMRNGDDSGSHNAASVGGDDECASGGFAVDLQQKQQQQQQQHQQKDAAENNNKIQNNLAMHSKDSLYATPLKKSDRPKPQGATPKSRPITARATGTSMDDNLNNSNCSGSDRDVKIINAELEDRRIRDFLKDTTQMHKKIELHKEYQSSNFSYLARKEHFVNLVQQMSLTIR